MTAPTQTQQGAGKQSAEGEVEAQERTIPTPDELEGFYIIKSVLREVTDPARITYRPFKRSLGILLDNTNHKPICRLYFGGDPKFVGLINQDKQEEKVPIEKFDDLYKYVDRLKATVAMYDHPATQQHSIEGGRETREIVQCTAMGVKNSIANRPNSL